MFGEKKQNLLFFRCFLLGGCRAPSGSCCRLEWQTLVGHEKERKNEEEYHKKNWGTENLEGMCVCVRITTGRPHLGAPSTIESNSIYVPLFKHIVTSVVTRYIYHGKFSFFFLHPPFGLIMKMPAR